MILRESAFDLPINQNPPTHKSASGLVNYLKWSLWELNPCPNWVLTHRSFTGLAFLTLKAGIVHYPERRML